MNPANIQAVIAAALEQQSKQFEAQLADQDRKPADQDKKLSDLMAKVNIKDKSPSGSQKVTPMSNKKISAGPTQTTQSPTNKRSINTTAKGKSSTSSSHPAPSTTPLNQKRKVSTPKTKSPKGSPFRMVSTNMPESFSTTRGRIEDNERLSLVVIEGCFKKLGYGQSIDY
ncbi:hypothetical protein VP01_13g7 [Puccinia sorghi]|uniref:Uncharacterized protein n=1 Tax=Puccinia sorghi TaxID=27349 RepID=A0A0L6VKZ3_9BASI|nr:hypothetical protein VP01_13g7 [Puccinia sorghi]